MKPSPVTLTKMRCGCSFDPNGALVETCAGHRQKIVALQVAKRTTPTPGFDSPAPARTSPSTLLLRWLALALVVGVWVLVWRLVR